MMATNAFIKIDQTKLNNERSKIYIIMNNIQFNLCLFPTPGNKYIHRLI